MFVLGCASRLTQVTYVYINKSLARQERLDLEKKGTNHVEPGKYLIRIVSLKKTRNYSVSFKELALISVLWYKIPTN